jgi:hypothetical protein
MLLMPTLRRSLTVALLISGAALAAAPPKPASPAPAPPKPERAARLHERAPGGGSLAWELLESLTTEVGPRPVGSPAMERARDWALARFAALGLQNVHAEPFTKENAWVRGAESAALVAPSERALAVIGLGNSVPTPAGGIEADAVVFATLEALTAAPPDSLAGKIAVVNQPMTRTQDFEGYEYAVSVRARGASVAAQRGAVAFLTRSIATGNSRAPHTGALAYEDGAPKIPAAALGVADAELLSRLAARGLTPRIRLNLASSALPTAAAWNIVGEVPGREPGAGVILIGGHLDSWDPGEGAVDDGAGVAITAAAAHQIAALPAHPRRTIRVVAWGSEETGGSGTAYAAAHATDAASIVIAGEADAGAGRVYRLRLPKRAADDPLARQLRIALAPLNIFVSGDAPNGGADLQGLASAGVPMLELTQDVSQYFDLHHSADDTLDKVNRADLDQCVAAWAAVLELLAESSADFR